MKTYHSQQALTMKRAWLPLLLLGAAALALAWIDRGAGGRPRGELLAATGTPALGGKGGTGGGAPDERAVIGLSMSPLPLNLTGKSQQQVGLGSYFVNAVADCNSCHSTMPFLPGGDPFLGEPKMVDPDTYLTGGQSFGPVVSRNLRPETGTGLPAGLTLQQFVNAMRYGTDYDHPGRLLQVMPWPSYHDMTDDDLTAIYQYLLALPPVPPPS